MKRQKRCNFCGNELPYPKKFTFQRKCPTCSLKNSTFIFPARFLCNSCLEGSHNDVHRVETDQIPLENLKNAEILHSDSLVRKLQSLVSRSIEVALRDYQDEVNAALYFDPNTPCFNKLTSKDHLYSQLVTFLLNRMLSIMKELVKHDIPLEPTIVDTFTKLASNRDRLTEVFTLTKERIKQV